MGRPNNRNCMLISRICCFISTIPEIIYCYCPTKNNNICNLKGSTSSFSCILKWRIFEKIEGSLFQYTILISQGCNYEKNQKQENPLALSSLLSLLGCTLRRNEPKDDVKAVILGPDYYLMNRHRH